MAPAAWSESYESLKASGHAAPARQRVDEGQGMPGPAQRWERRRMKDGVILLVEDNPDDELLALRALKKNDVRNEVVVAHDGVEALDYLFASGPYSERDASAMPQLILLDLKLPKVDGLEVLKTPARRRANAALARGHPDLIQRAKRRAGRLRPRRQRLRPQAGRLRTIRKGRRATQALLAGSQRSPANGRVGRFAPRKRQQASGDRE